MANKETAATANHTTGSPAKDGKKSVVEPEPKQGPMSGSDWYTLILLLVVNLANFADRVTASAVLESIRETYNVESDTFLSLLQTSFIVTYMLFSPFFGYLGDRYNRRILMAIGFFAWGCFSLASAFISPDIPNAYWIFLVLRSLVGIGEASYVTISPTIISDLFVGRRRTLVILAYQSMMLLGSGAGYMVASLVLSATGNWQNSFMVWPPIVFLCMFGLIFMKEPIRGGAESVTDVETTSYWEDVKYLIKIKSYIFCTIAYTCVVFVIGAMQFWAPSFATIQIQIENPEDDGALVAFIFGFLVVLGGICGALMGTGASKWLRTKKPIGDSADALVCGIGGVVSGILLYLTYFSSAYNTVVMWVMIFFSMTFLSINLVLNTEITLYILIPTRRATGSGVMILISHVFGDAFSPYLIGEIIDALEGGMRANGKEPNNLEAFTVRQEALYFTSCVCVLGALFYFMCSLYVVEDKDNAKTLAASMSRASMLNKMGGENIEMQKSALPPPPDGGIYMVPAEPTGKNVPNDYLDASHKLASPVQLSNRKSSTSTSSSSQESVAV